MRWFSFAAAVLFGASAFTAAQAADYAGTYRGGHHLRSRAPIGSCVRTRVAAIGTPAGGAAVPTILYRDGVIQAFDGDMLGHSETRPGDPIQLCLIAFTRDCGEDDLPGRTYATGNLRTGAAWTLPDVRSSCTPR